MATTAARLQVLWVLLALGACAGDLGAGDTPAGDTPGTGSDGTGLAPGAGPGTESPPPGEGPLGDAPVDAMAAMAGCSVAPPEAPLRRLTRSEYNNTVRDLVGDMTRPASQMLDDEAQAGFAANTYAAVQPLHVRQYLDAAAALAARVDIGALSGCSGEDDSCAERFVRGFGMRAYRRPMSETEVTALLDLYADERTRAGAQAGLRLVVEALLSSPHFLYRPELGVPAAGQSGVVQLTGYELAARLSYLLWATMPDADLLRAAGSGELDTRTGLAAAVDRMLASPRFMTALDSFHGQWLKLERVRRTTKDESLFPEWSAVANAAAEDALAFSRTAMTEGEGTFMQLLDPAQPFAFVDEALAGVYGVEGSEDGVVRVALPEGERAGLLTSVAFLAGQSGTAITSPVHRGGFVRKQLLCQKLVPPPDTVDTSLSPLGPNATTRELFEAHRSDPVCAGCHQLTDPIGFGFEHYDVIGRYRTEEAGRPIDASGELVQSDIDGTFDGAIELSQRLGQSEQVEYCMTRHWFRYAMGRQETADEQCMLKTLADPSRAANLGARDVLRALVTSDVFRFATLERAAPMTPSDGVKP